MSLDPNQVEILRAEADRIADSKGKDYRKGSSDLCANFKMASEAAGMRPLQAWLVYLLKHHTAVVSFVKNAGQHESEPIFQRFVDVYNYIRLGWLLCAESDFLAPKPVLEPPTQVPQAQLWDSLNTYVKRRKLSDMLTAHTEAAGDMSISKVSAWLPVYVVQYRRITDLVRVEAEAEAMKRVEADKLYNFPPFVPSNDFLMAEFVKMLQEIEVGWVLLNEVYPQK